MNYQILAEHKCKGKCPEFKSEQCRHCLIQQIEIERLNHKCELQATEMLSMQTEIDLLKAASETERAIEQEIDAVVCLRDGVIV